MEEGGGEGASLEYTPTWVLAVICTLIIAISLAIERLLHYLGHVLQHKQQKPLYEALLKVKEELMLLGFISLLLTVFQSAVSKICMSKKLVKDMLPCKIEEEEEEDDDDDSNATTSHFRTYFASTMSGGTRHLLAKASSNSLVIGYCGAKDKVPLLSIEALHHMHIFIFVLAISHVTICGLTVSFGGLKIRKWKQWEDEIRKEDEGVLEKKVTHVHQHDFIKDRFLGFGKDSVPLAWLNSFIKQFYTSVTKSDYETLRLGFIMMHCRGNPKFNFHKYMIRALEDDFKEVVGIRLLVSLGICYRLLVAKCSWYGIRLVVDLYDTCWHTYFWIVFIPFILLLVVGTKLEHVITKLAHEVAEKHVAVEGELVVKPSDEHFWFDNPRIVLYLIHFILFQNAFEIAFFFWIWVQFGFNSCLMGQVSYIFPRLLIGVLIQVLCSYSTLPLYAIVAQMGSMFNKAIFEDNVQASLLGWAKKVKKKKALKQAIELSAESTPSEVSIQVESDDSSLKEDDRKQK
ncbi:MLO-like protein 1 [Gossypium australe]|uniref:MLO-like protein n=1 Tax=Gossypium australe TaxID=47621 RepID=A0A5B6VVF2_9ROSI|nr:MLO-like protein 1 [Gossypium australe]